MDRAWLTDALASGRSIESIAREVGKDPSTVAYWVGKHGLTSVHAEKHAARGGLTREQLEPLVAADYCIRRIAEETGRSYATVRHWLGYHGLRTSTAARRRNPVPPEARPARVERECPKHGQAEFVLRDRGTGYRCVRCRSEQVADWRRRVKVRLIEEAGGRCELCGYDRCVAALEFHHRDPATKRFGIGSRGLGRALAELRAEAGKCALLCSNCHAEVEAGYSSCPPDRGWQIGNASHC